MSSTGLTTKTSTEDCDVVTQCEKNIALAIESSPMIRTMLRAMQAEGCEVDLPRHIVCEPCNDERLFGGFDQPLSQVFICSNRCKTPQKVEEILSHELVHLYDHCTAELDLKNINHLACTEIRAANFAHCRGKFDPRECVIGQATSSVRAVVGCTEQQALQAVADVFQKCYNDLEPFGRCISRSADDHTLAHDENLHYFKSSYHKPTV